MIRYLICVTLLLCSFQYSTAQLKIKDSVVSNLNPQSNLFWDGITAYELQSGKILILFINHLDSTGNDYGSFYLNTKADADEFYQEIIKPNNNNGEHIITIDLDDSEVMIIKDRKSAKLIHYYKNNPNLKKSTGWKQKSSFKKLFGK